MIKNSLKKKIFSSIVLGSVVTSLSITAFASDLNQEETSQEISSKKEISMKYKENKKGHQRMEENLKESGIFTDSEIEEIKTYLESKKAEIDKERESLKDKTKEERKAYFEANKDKKEGMMSDLVTDGVITQDQLDKLKEIMPKGKSFGHHKDGARGHQRMKENLKESGIFTDSEIEEIKTYLESKKAEIDKERESLKDKTKEERKAYFEANKDKKEGMMSDLVTDGVITQDQLDKLKEIMSQNRQSKNK